MKKLICCACLFLLSSSYAKADSIVSYINQERANYLSKPLTENSILDKTAKYKACDMVSRNYWSHIDPDGKYSWEYIRKYGYKYKKAGEDIARGFTSDKEIVKAWVSSPPHKTVLVDPKYREVGIGRCGNIVVAHFGVR